MRRKIDVSDLKAIQLDIMDDIHAFCETNGIRYFLAYGTLIGAVRHKGYIPWDDDIDICMPRPDYDKFIELYNKKPSSYRMVCYENSMDYQLPFGKVHDTRTVMNEMQYKSNESFGVYIDIFPIDGFANDKLLQKAQILRRMLNAKKALFGKGRSIAKELFILFGKIYLFHTSARQILSKIDSVVRTAEFDKTELVGYLPSLNKGRKGIFPRHYFEESILSDFDGRRYRIPIEYDNILTSEYGDYMKEPSDDNKVSTHVFEAWWKETTE